MSSFRGAEEETVESGMNAVIPGLLSGYLGVAGIRWSVVYASPHGVHETGRGDDVQRQNLV